MAKYRPSLWLELTGACNLSCDFCYNPWRPEAGADQPGPVNFSDLTSSIGLLSDRVDFEYVALSGGEPLMYPDLVPLIQWLRERHLYSILTTNGTLLSNAKLEELRNAGLNSAQISLTSIREDVHNRLTRSHSWATTIGAIARSVASGISTTVVVTVTRENLSDLSRTVGFLAELGVDRVTISRLQLGGSATVNIESLEYRESEFEEELGRVRLILADRSTAISISPPVRSNGPAGWHRWAVSPRGELKLCNTSSEHLGTISQIPVSRIDRIAADWGAGDLADYDAFAGTCGCFARRLPST